MDRQYPFDVPDDVDVDVDVDEDVLIEQDNEHIADRWLEAEDYEWEA